MAPSLGFLKGLRTARGGRAFKVICKDLSPNAVSIAPQQRHLSCGHDRVKGRPAVSQARRSSAGWQTISATGGCPPSWLHPPYMNVRNSATVVLLNFPNEPQRDAGFWLSVSSTRHFEQTK
eukprot:3687228-Amphidinium_carterae.1